MMTAEATFRQKVVRMLRHAQKLHRTNGEDGSALLEMALSATIFLSFLFGVIETGYAAYTYHVISEAAREGTRFAIVRGSTCSGFATACPAAPSDITSYVETLGFPGLSLSNITVTPAWSAFAAGSSCPAAPSPCNSPGNTVTVTVQYNFPLSVPFIPTKPIAMMSSSAMIISQ